MNNNWLKKMKQFLKSQNPKTMKKICLVLLALGVAVTMNHALALPAVTTEGTLICAQEEHSHDENCYHTDTKLICTNEEEGHQHDENCYYSEEKLVCLLQEHTHTENCYEKPEQKNEQNEDVSLQNSEEEDSGISAHSIVNLDINWIQSVDAKHQGQWDVNNWQTIKDGEEIKENDQLRFRLEYTIPSGTLSENDIVEYQLPNAFNKVKAESGNILNEYGTIMGTYTIEENGKVTFKFNESTIAGNSSSPIEGTFSFDCSQSDLKKEDNGDYKIPFNSEITFDFKSEEKKANSEDLSGWKTQSEYDKEKGTITYTITINSKNGTGDKIKVKDWMENVRFDGIEKIEHKDKDGNTKDVTSQYEYTNTETDFNLELDSLKENESYTISYTVNVAYPEDQTEVLTKNKVKVSSKDKDGKDLDFESSVEKNVDYKNLYTYIQKKYVGEDKENKKFKWEITVNPEKQDIGGMTLKDYLNGIELKDLSVHIDPPIQDEEGKEQSEIKLPYTFPEGTKKTFTITYETDNDIEVGSSQAVNKGVMEYPGGNGSQDSSGWSDYGEKYYPIEKEGTSIEITEDRKSVVMDWKVTIKADRGEVRGSDGSEQWVYEDKLENDQYFSQEQFNTLKAEIEKNPYVDHVEATEIWGVGIHGFKVYFKKPLEKGGIIQFAYSSTGNLQDATTAASFRNTGRINEKEWIGVTLDYVPGDPTIEKVDANNNNSGDSSYDYDNLEDKKLKWHLNLTIPKDYKDGDITLLEKLPEGLELTDLKYGDMDLHPDRIAEDSAIKVTQEKNNFKIVILQEYISEHSLKNMQFFVAAQIPESFEGWNADYNNPAVETSIFKNSVSVIVGEDREVDFDSQSQTVKKDENKNILKKAGKQVGNTVVYDLIVNPEGKDILKDQDTLTLEDELRFYTDENRTFNMFLVPNSVKVYKYDETKPDHKGDQLPAQSCPYIYTAYNDYQWECRKLEITIPDSMPLVVEYQYSCNVTDYNGQNIYRQNIENKANIKGVTISDDQNKDNRQVEIQESSATARLSGLSLIKVDSENNALTLGGAKFRLDVWDMASKSYVPVKDGDADYTLTSNKDGNIHISMAKKNAKEDEHLQYNTAYRLVEIKAPAGYELNEEPFEFYFYRQEGEKKIPDNFKGKIFHEAATAYYENTSVTTEISVLKIWKDADGNTMTDPDAKPVYFNVYQKLTKKGSSDSSNEPEEAQPYLGPFTLSKENNWQWTIKELPKEVVVEEEGKDVIYECSYYVKEVDGIEEEYINNGGILTGMIQIINDYDTPPPAETRLPESGNRWRVIGSSYIDAALAALAGLYVIVLLKSTSRE